MKLNREGVGEIVLSLSKEYHFDLKDSVHHIKKKKEEVHLDGSVD